MPLIRTRPLTPSQRFRVYFKETELSKERPVKTLTKALHRKKGRNCHGRITVRRRGGGHKRLYRTIDFRRERVDVPAKVIRLEYDPNRTSHIALLEYADGELRYIPAPRGLEVGATVMTVDKAVETYNVGLCCPLRFIPPSTFIHCIELLPQRGAKFARAAGQQAQLINVEGEYATVKMPSGELRLIHANCRATIGRVGNVEHQEEGLGKAGRSRWLGKRPRVRGMVMNPVDHPNGGGQGKSKGGGGHLQPVSPWGQLAKGFPTRKKSNPTNTMIIVRRNGRKVKKR